MDPLIKNVKILETHKNAIPVMKREIAAGTCHYIAGSLIIRITDEVSGDPFYIMNIRPIDNYESEIMRESQYLASRMYIKHKNTRCSFYQQALENVKIYEGRDGDD